MAMTASRSISPKSLPKANHCTADQSDTHLLSSSAMRVASMAVPLRGTCNDRCKLPSVVTDSMSISCCSASIPHLRKASGISTRPSNGSELSGCSARSSESTIPKMPARAARKRARFRSTHMWRLMRTFSLFDSCCFSAMSWAPGSAMARGKRGIVAIFWSEEMSSSKPLPKKPSSTPAEMFTSCGTVASPSGGTGFDWPESKTLRMILPTSRPKARASLRVQLARARSMPSRTSAPLAMMRPLT
mmetsp:Transcript_96917/g.301702  ORF Transcript_96917/g.301702 Transcript_96917/m.301702 type:complete len:245 (+) Transcript_96917:831-1565(+)